jgi:CO/xanthine dehydrogenase FAD-binding subunit
MIPAEFDYVAPETLDETIRVLVQHGEDAKLLAGGHSLLPLMKLPRYAGAPGRSEEGAWTARSPA